MDARTFLDNFATIADAPGGVQRLRGMVRQLAVTGRLAAPVELAERRDDGPFEIPAHWTWSSMQGLHTKLGSGSTPRGGKNTYVSRGVAFIRSQNVWNDGLRLSGVARIPEETHAQMAGTAVRPGDVLLNITGASIGRACVVPDDFDEEANVSQHVAILRPLDPRRRRWVHLFMVSPAGFDAVMSDQVGISREGLSMKRLRGFAVPVPPLEEQERIVAKVDELMGLCEDLEARQERRHHATIRFRGSALDALTGAETPDDLRCAWDRASDSWSVLTSHPESIPELRRSILSLAVSGRLASQDPEDQPAIELLGEIARSQVELKRERGLHGVRLPVAQPSLPAPPLPEGWAWARLGALLRHCRNGIATRPNEGGVGYPLLRISAGTSDQNGCVNLADHKFAELDAEDVGPYVVESGDLLACRFNGNLHYVGRAAVVPEHVGEYVHPDKLICLRAISTDHRYLMVAMNSPLVRAQIEDVASTTAGNIGINAAQLQALHVPVPPFREQTRIADRVEHLLRLCTDLEASFPREVASVVKLSNGLTSALVSAQRVSVAATG